MFLPVSQSFRQSCLPFFGQHNFVKLSSYEGQSMKMRVHTGKLDSFFLSWNYATIELKNFVQN